MASFDGQGYFTYNHPVARALMIRAVAWSAGRAAAIETSAPLAVQTVMYRKDQATLLPGGASLAVSARDGLSEVVVPEIQIHALVVFQ